MIPPYPPHRRETNHFLNGLLSVITMGIWAPIWLLISLNNDRYNKQQWRKYHQDLIRYEIWKREFYDAQQ